MAKQSGKTEHALFEEDDEFEEFPAEGTEYQRSTQWRSTEWLSPCENSPMAAQSVVVFFVYRVGRGRGRSGR